MKVFRLSIMFCFVLLLFSYCSNQQDKDREFLVSHDTLLFDAKGGTDSLYITADGEWSIDNIPDWISLSQINGYGSCVIQFEIASLNKASLRSTKVFVSNGERTLDVLIKQNGRGENIVWSSLQFSVFENVNQDGDLFKFKTSRTYFSPVMFDEMYVGNLLSRKLSSDLKFKTFDMFEFNPITVSLGSSPFLTKTYTPSLSEDLKLVEYYNQNKDRGELVSSNIDGLSYNSYRELFLIGMGNLGIELDKEISGDSYLNKEMSRQNGLIYSFYENSCTLMIDIPDALIKDTIISEEFKQAYPAYISSILYGRIGLLLVEADGSIDIVRRLISNIIHKENYILNNEEKLALNNLDAYHLFYDQSGILNKVIGNINAIYSYRDQMKSEAYEVCPIRIEVSDFFDHSLSFFEYELDVYKSNN